MPPLRFNMILIVLLSWGTAALGQEEFPNIVEQLNSSPQVDGTEQSKSYRILFDAYLELSPPPFEIGPDFNQTTIWPGMEDWDQVSAWAEGNQAMAEAILKSGDRNIIGLPYGKSSVDSVYQSRGLHIEIGVEGNLRRSDFPYLKAMRVIAAFSTANHYRLCEAKNFDDAQKQIVACLRVYRMFCDRDFFAEKVFAITMLSDSLSILRDIFYTYLDEMPGKIYQDFGREDIPFLQPTRNRLAMPEGDRIVSTGLIDLVFDEGSGKADPQMFRKVFTDIQAESEPLTRFGAARRWEKVAALHSPRKEAHRHLILIYDDWWRRWRVQEYDPILERKSEFDRTNPVRYAAVLYAIRDIKELFAIRNLLIVQVNGTAISAGLCAYHKEYGNYPNDSKKIYPTYTRKRSNVDAFDINFDPLIYRYVAARRALDTSLGRVWLKRGSGLLYSVGQDHEDGLGEEHVPIGATGDVVIWPPVRTIVREASQSS